MNMELSKRLISLDVLRGLTVATMILVNNGVGHEQFTTLQHSAWNGLTLCDLVFPFFLFMVGVSVHLSIGRRNLTPSADTVYKILKRTILLFSIGVLLHLWESVVGGKDDVFMNLRIWGVLQRIALCYCGASLLVLFISMRHVWKIVIMLLTAYSCLLVFGNGYAQDETNIVSIADHLLLADSHLYHKSVVDPEGLLGTLPALAHTLIGVQVGWVLMRKESLQRRLKIILFLAVVMGVLGYFLQFYFPLNKRIWSPSYVLVTCALATASLALLFYAIDVRGYKRWSIAFQMFGINAFFLYVLSEVVAPLLRAFDIPEIVFTSMDSVVHSAPCSSFIYAATFTFVMWLIACLMWYRKWIVKI